MGNVDLGFVEFDAVLAPLKAVGVQIPLQLDPEILKLDLPCPGKQACHDALACPKAVQQHLDRVHFRVGSTQGFRLVHQYREFSRPVFDGKPVFENGFGPERDNRHG